MRVRLMETDPARVRAVVRDFGIRGEQRASVLALRIAAAYRREVAAETAREMVRRVRERA